MKTDPETIVARVMKVASLPAVALKFSEAIDDPLSTNQDLENIISDDSALASRILRIANSALYNFPTKIDTISKALSIIGQKQVNDIILSCSIINAFGKISQNFINMEQFWRHNLAVASAARVIASLRREHNIEVYFVAGLLHDIGRLVLLTERTTTMNQGFESVESEKKFIYQKEREFLGFDHAHIGSLLMKKWKLPPVLWNTIKYHHVPSQASGYQVEAGIVHLADIIAHGLELGASGEKYVPSMDKKIWGMLDMDINLVPIAVDQVYVQYEEAVKYMLDS